MDLSEVTQGIYSHKYKVNFVEYTCEHISTPMQYASITYNIKHGKKLITTIKVIFSEYPDNIHISANTIIIHAAQYPDMEFLRYLEHEAAYNNYYLNLYALKSFGVVDQIRPVSSMFVTEKKRIYALIKLHEQYPECLYIPFLSGNYSEKTIKTWCDQEIKKELGINYRDSVIKAQEQNFSDRHLEIQYRPMYK